MYPQTFFSKKEKKAFFYPISENSWLQVLYNVSTHTEFTKEYVALLWLQNPSILRPSEEASITRNRPQKHFPKASYKPQLN